MNAQNNTVLPWFAETIDRPIAPVMVKSAPCQEIIIEGEDVDLGKFPIPKFSELDGGPYLMLVSVFPKILKLELLILDITGFKL